MIEKYLKLIQEKKSQKDVLQNFLEKEIGLSNFSFDINGIFIKIEASSSDRFIMQIKKEEIENFLKTQGLKIKHK